MRINVKTLELKQAAETDERLQDIVTSRRTSWIPSTMQFNCVRKTTIYNNYAGGPRGTFEGLMGDELEDGRPET